MSNDCVRYYIYCVRREQPHPNSIDGYTFDVFTSISRYCFDEKQRELLKDNDVVWMNSHERKYIPTTDHQDMIGKDKNKLIDTAFKKLFKDFEEDFQETVDQFSKISNDTAEFEARLNRFVHYQIYERKHRWDVEEVVNEVSKNE